MSFAYDALGRATNLVDAVGTTTYAYAHGLLQYEDGPWTTGTNGWTDRVTYGYHTARLCNQMILSQPAGNAWTNSHSWDVGHRLSSVTSPAGTHTYTYNGPGRQTRRLAHPGFQTANFIWFSARCRQFSTVAGEFPEFPQGCPL